MKLNRRFGFRTAPRRPTRRGHTLSATVIFTGIVSVLLGGVATFAASHQQRAIEDSRFASALNYAEAGANFEMRKISLDPASADQYPGVTYNVSGGTFKVHCANPSNPDDTAPWTPQERLYVISTGTYQGVSRTVQVAVKGYKPDARYAIYGTGEVSTFNGSAVLINGDVGTNNSLSFTGHPVINGQVHFSGPLAGWQTGDPGGYTVLQDPRPVTWASVSDIANQEFPAGGLTYLKLHNDNGRANPPITGFSITNSVTLPAGNYYLENINLSGGRAITFDNTNGPVTIWIGPAGGSGVARFRGGAAAIPISSDPSKAPRIMVATAGGIDLGGNTRLDGLVYAANRDASGAMYGHIENSGNPTIYGQLVGNDVDINGDITVNFVTRLIEPTSIDYYGFDNSWAEVGGR